MMPQTWREATRFTEVIDAFETCLEHQIFTFSKLQMYEPSRPEEDCYKRFYAK